MTQTRKVSRKASLRPLFLRKSPVFWQKFAKIPAAVTIHGENFAQKKFTGKELDPETGLYYYGARYLDPKTARWLSGDPAIGDYIPSAPVNDEARKQNQSLPGQGGVFNAVNLHAYHYAGNNPVRYTDPNGEWGKDVHYGSEKWGGTLKWAQDDNRFTSADAKIIATSNNATDHGPTGPMPWQNPSRHFNTNNAPSGSYGDSRKIYAENHLHNAITLKNEANRLRANGGFFNNISAWFKERNALRELGRGLHSLQDTDAHADKYIRVKYGIIHHDDPRNPLTLGLPNLADDPKDNEERIENTETETKRYLDRYLEATR